jgi:hypothetical protein
LAENETKPVQLVKPDDPVRVELAEAERMIQLALAHTRRYLNSTTLVDVLPDLRVEQASKHLAWDLAIKLADERYPGNPMRRALFLSSFVEPGFPVERLAALKLKEIVGPCSGQTCAKVVILRDKPTPVYMDFGLAIGKGLMGPPTIRALGVPWKGVTYSCLSFNEHGLLMFFERTILLKGGGELRIGGNGKDSCNLIRISADGKIGPGKPLKCD